MLRRCGALAVAAGVAVVVGGCGGSSGPPSAGPGTTTPPVTTTAIACPAPSKSKPAAWPKSVPVDLPKPPHVVVLDHQTASDGVDIVKFRTPSSLRESVLFVVDAYPKAGYVLGRGDAEATEADAPFIHGNIRGLVRMLTTGACQTDWLLATVNTQSPTGTPLLPVHTPSGSPSPLPFG
jgi:hypothetical protein